MRREKNPFRTFGWSILGVAALAIGFRSMAASLAPVDPFFTFVIVPDPQNMVMSNGAVWTSLCQWVVDNRVSENIEAVLTVGDLVNNPTDVQFTTSSVGLSLIEATGIPVLPIAGNHDYDGSNPANRALTKFDQYYGPAHFTGKTWYRGNLNGSNANYYVTFDVGTRKFLVVVLEMYPRPAAVSWASGIVDANADRETIVLTHGFLYSDGLRIQDTTTQGPDTHSLPAADASGEEIWTNLVKNKLNMRAVLCGHVANSTRTAHRTDFGDRGNPIHQILSNYQLTANGGNGWIGLMKFNLPQKTVEIRYYRTYAPSGLGLDPNAPAYTLAWSDDVFANQRPVVSAGDDRVVSGLAPVALSGSVTDDGRPNPPAATTAIWTKQSGPGDAAFVDATVPSTAVTFSAVGVYVLRLTGSDGELSASDDVTVTITSPGANGLRVRNVMDPSSGTLPVGPYLDTDAYWVGGGEPADAGAIRIYDARGALVRTYENPSFSTAWDGKNEADEPVAPGLYVVKTKKGAFRVIIRR